MILNHTDDVMLTANIERHAQAGVIGSAGIGASVIALIVRSGDIDQVAYD